MPRIAYVFFAFLMVTFTAAVLSSCDAPRQEPLLSRTTTALAGVIHDPETGCEYIVTSGNTNAGITPRLSPGGKPICRPHDQE